MRMPTLGLLFFHRKKLSAHGVSLSRLENYRSRCKVSLTGCAAASEWYIVFIRQNLGESFIVRRIL